MQFPKPLVDFFKGNHRKYSLSFTLIRTSRLILPELFIVNIEIQIFDIDNASL